MCWLGFGYAHPETPIQAPIDRKKTKMKTSVRPVAPGLSVAPLQSPQARITDKGYKRMFRKLRKGEESKSEGAGNDSDDGSDIEMRLGEPDGASHDRDEESDSDDFPSELIAIDNLESIEAEFNEANKAKVKQDVRPKNSKYQLSPLKHPKGRASRKESNEALITCVEEHPDSGDEDPPNQPNQRHTNQAVGKKEDSESDSSSDSFIQEVSKPESPGQDVSKLAIKGDLGNVARQDSEHSEQGGCGDSEIGSSLLKEPRAIVDQVAAKSTTRHDLDEIYMAADKLAQAQDRSASSVSEDSEAVTLNSQLQDGESASIREYRKMRAQQHSPGIRKKGASVRGAFGHSHQNEAIMSSQPTPNHDKHTEGTQSPGLKIQRTGTLDC